MKKKLLKTRLKNSHSCIIEIDEEIRGILPGRILKRHGLEKEQEIAIEDSLAEEIERDIYVTANRRFLNWLTNREHTEGECRQYLKRVPVAQDLADRLISEAKEYKYLDDERFVQLYIEYMIENKKSQLETRHKLLERLLSDEAITAGMARYFDDNKQREVLTKNIKYFNLRWRNLNKDKRKQKMFNALVHRGFNYHDIDMIFQKVNDEEEERY